MWHHAVTSSVMNWPRSCGIFPVVYYSWVNFELEKNEIISTISGRLHQTFHLETIYNIDYCVQFTAVSSDEMDNPAYEPQASDINRHGPTGPVGCAVTTVPSAFAQQGPCPPVIQIVPPVGYQVRANSVFRESVQRFITESLVSWLWMNQCVNQLNDPLIRHSVYQ